MGYLYTVTVLFADGSSAIYERVADWDVPRHVESAIATGLGPRTMTITREA